MKLFWREYGEPDMPPIILLHGLLGSLVNWHSIARKLSADWRVITVDLRNHGRSPHHPDMTYPLMAADVVQLMDHLMLDDAVIAGHSMGGKVAMWLALNDPQRVRALVSVDIAPVNYPMRLTPVLDALLAMPLEQVTSRQRADELLEVFLAEKSLRDYLLQNLVREDDRWHWRNNLTALRENMPAITRFPPMSQEMSFSKPALLIHGLESDYVKPEYHDEITKLFPRTQIKGIENAGHWLYAEQPEIFISELTQFLNTL